MQNSPVHFKAYHQDTALLFQFIYSECLSSHHELQTLLNDTEELSFEKISSTLNKLTGSGNSSTQLFSWCTQDGILTKLKNNCFHFSQITDIKSDLHLHADKAWLLCLECFNPINRTFSELSNEAFSHMQSLAKELKNLIVHFKHDENVVYFLLRHQNQLKNLHNTRFDDLYPEGIQSAIDFIIDRYTQRGFTHLIPAISELKQPT